MEAVIARAWCFDYFGYYGDLQGFSLSHLIWFGGSLGATLTATTWVVSWETRLFFHSNDGTATIRSERRD